MFRFWTLLLALLFCGFASLILLIGWIFLGFIGGSELCPHTFKTRDFGYWQPAFFTLGINKVEKENDQFAISLELTGVLKPEPHVRWDLIEDNFTSRMSRDQEAKFLTDVIFRRSASAEFAWVEWTIAHPDQAARLWPWVRRLAVDRLYVITPELFFQAKAAEHLPPDEFEAILSKTIHRELQWLSREAIDAGRYEDQERFDLALIDYGFTGGAKASDDLSGQ